MKKYIGFLLLFFNACTITSLAQTRIGYANPNEILPVMPEAVKVDSLVYEFKLELEKDYTKKENEINSLYEKFILDSSKLTKAVKEAKRITIQDKLAELPRIKERYNQLIQEESEKLLKPVKDKLFAAIQSVAKENGYAVILYNTAGVTLSKENDINPKIKKKLGL